MKNNFPLVINKLCDILGLEYLTELEIDLLKQETTIESLREKSRIGKSEYYPSKRKDNWKQFRKGVEGNWVEYFTKGQLLHINNIEKGVVSYFLKFHYFLLFTLRRFLGNIE